MPHALKSELIRVRRLVRHCIFDEPHKLTLKLFQIKMGWLSQSVGQKFCLQSMLWVRCMLCVSSLESPGELNREKELINGK